MKEKLLRKLRGELALFIFTIVCLLVKELIKNKWNLKGVSIESWLEIFNLAYLVPSIYLIGHLFFMLKSQLYNPLFSIKSKLLEKTGYDFCKNSIIKISSTLSTLLNSKSKNILWELEHIELNDLEQICLEGNFPVSGATQCDTIRTRIKKHRRIRITTIADSLILRNSFCKKSEYFATETRLPSSIINDDSGYYAKQEENLKKNKPKKACRLLILKKSEIQQELTENRAALEQFIKWNNVAYGKNKKLQLKIIVYVNKLEDVFSEFTLESYYDFVISKKGKQITVFAQDENNNLTVFDSSYGNNATNAESFYDAFQKLFDHSDVSSQTSQYIAYSGVITTIEEAGNFININNKK